ncbi:MAG: BMP family ABC transporter substrate-binding protein [Deltaproteobacteria bacterium]|nr:BMP family ABC transporter substrate-binding protein [Deltaproteobacteria bacterium]
MLRVVFNKSVCFLSLYLLLLTAEVFSAEKLKIGLVLDKGGKDDKSFNSAAFAGATQAEKDLGIELKYVEATDVNSLENLHRQFAKKNYDLVIGIGFAQSDAVKKISAQFPKVNFAIVDGEVKSTNVRSLLFEEHQGSFLVGALAVMKSHGSKIGFIGGMDIPLIRRFSMGYEAGMKQASSKGQLIQNYIGISSEAWNNPAKAKELALNQYNQGVDVIFVAAGASNSGVFDAAEEKKKFAIGVDSNQNWIKPGFILTSMLKRVDKAVYSTIEDLKNGKFTSGVVRYGLKDKGVDYSVDKFNEKLISSEQIKTLEALKVDIINGKIKVPDYYLEKK